MRFSIFWGGILMYLGLCCTSCTFWVSRTAIEAKARKAQDKLDVPIYFAASEVGAPFEVVGTVHWYKLSIFSSKAKIGLMARKKGARLLRKGKLKQIDGILIQDRFNAHFIKNASETGALVPLRSTNPPASPVENEPAKFLGRTLDYTPLFTRPEEKPSSFRWGGGVTVPTQRGGYAGIQARGAYKLSSLPALELGLDLGWWASRPPRTLLAQICGRYYFDAKQLGWFPIEMRLYPLAGINISPYRRAGERTLSPGSQLGLGAEYRLTENLMLFLESQAVWRRRLSNIALFNLGLMIWQG